MVTTPQRKLDLDWSGYTCIICATGPSFSEEQAERVLESQRRGAKVITVNDGYRRIPEPDLLYACDWSWWQMHLERAPGDAKFNGKRVTASPLWKQIPESAGMVCIPGGTQRAQCDIKGQAWYRTPWRVTYGSASGFQAVNLALHTGADPILLVGYDCRLPSARASHFFGRHGGRLSNPTSDLLRKVTIHFAAAAKDWPEAAARIRNATPESAIGCFETIEL